MDSTALLTLQSAQTAAQIGQQQASFLRSEAAQARANVRGGQSSLPATGVAGTGTTTKNAKLGQDFEAMCLSNMLSPMFDGISTDGPFGGGQAEGAMRSFFIDAIAKEMTKRGGIGISDMMQQQLLRLQEA